MRRTARYAHNIARVTRYALWFFLVGLGDLMLLGVTKLWLDGNGALGWTAMAVGAFLMAGFLWLMGRPERRSAPDDQA